MNHNCKPAQIGYSNPGGQINCAVTHGNGLPFTGLDIGLVFAAGVLLTCIGAILRRSTHVN